MVCNLNVYPYITWLYYFVIFYNDTQNIYRNLSAKNKIGIKILSYCTRFILGTNII